MAPGNQVTPRMKGKAVRIVYGTGRMENPTPKKGVYNGKGKRQKPLCLNEECDKKGIRHYVLTECDKTPR